MWPPLYLPNHASLTSDRPDFLIHSRQANLELVERAAAELLALENSSDWTERARFAWAVRSPGTGQRGRDLVVFLVGASRRMV
jgi:hypothetical protein